MRSVAILMHHGMDVFELAAATAVWGTPAGPGGPEFELRRASHRRRRVTASDGAVVGATHGLDGLLDADLVVVPGRPDPGAPVAPPLLPALAAAAAGGRSVAALGSAAFLLAEAGLLRGLRATTHWSLLDEFAAAFPEVLVRRDALYVQDRGLSTCAGGAATVDLCLHLVRGAHGADAAAAIARRLVAQPQRPSGHRQDALRPVPELRSRRGAVNATAQWAREHVHEPLSVRQLAARAGVSERTFTRAFTELTGSAPLRWLNFERVRRAQQLLECTELTVEAVATQVGFGSPQALRRHFADVLATTPTAYRQDFARRAAAAGHAARRTARPAGDGVRRGHRPPSRDR